MAVVSRVAMDDGIAATQLAVLIQSAVGTNPEVMTRTGNEFGVTQYFFGNGCWIFL